MSEDYLTLDACLKVGFEAETALYLNAEYNKAFKSGPKRQAADKARNDKSKGKAHHDSAKGCSSQGALQHPQTSF
jgi:hypothetical protein